MSHQIVVTVEENGSMNVQSPFPLPHTLGLLRIAEASLLRPVMAPQPSVQAAPAAALRHLNGGEPRV